MSDVRESVFFANVQNSPLKSPHQDALPPELDVAEPTIVEIHTFTRLDLSSENRTVDEQIIHNEKWLFGYSTAGSEVPATPESRLKGLRNILGNFEEYRALGTTSPTELLKKITLLTH